MYDEPRDGMYIWKFICINQKLLLLLLFQVEFAVKTPITNFNLLYRNNISSRLLTNAHESNKETRIM